MTWSYIIWGTTTSQLYLPIPSELSEEECYGSCLLCSVYLATPKKWVSFLMALALRIIILLEVKLAPILEAFCIFWEISLCHHACGSEHVAEFTGWLCCWLWKFPTLATIMHFKMFLCWCYFYVFNGSSLPRITMSGGWGCIHWNKYIYLFYFLSRLYVSCFSPCYWIV